jgi:hypothetical protein
VTGHACHTSGYFSVHATPLELSGTHAVCMGCLDGRVGIDGMQLVCQ